MGDLLVVNSVVETKIPECEEVQDWERAEAVAGHEEPEGHVGNHCTFFAAVAVQIVEAQVAGSVEVTCQTQVVSVVDENVQKEASGRQGRQPEVTPGHPQRQNEGDARVFREEQEMPGPPKAQK